MIVFLRRGPVYNGISCAPPRASIQRFAKPVSNTWQTIYMVPRLGLEPRTPTLKG